MTLRAGLTLFLAAAAVGGAMLAPRLAPVPVRPPVAVHPIHVAPPPVPWVPAPTGPGGIPELEVPLPPPPVAPPDVWEGWDDCPACGMG